MRAAMAKASVDDDFVGSGPTTDQLQHQIAKLMDKEAGLFLASGTGTRASLINVFVKCKLWWQMHYGRVYRQGELAKSYGLKLHIDGARIFNASTALGVPVGRLVSAADSVSVCLSKGLGAPAGSVIVGSKAFIAKARRLRQTLGGGMRQVGVLCAAGLVALHDMVGRLKDDHHKCRILAEGLNGIDGLHVNLDAVHTNIVFVDITADSTPGAQVLCEAMMHEGVLSIPMGFARFRLLTHHQISEDDVRYTIACFKNHMQGTL